MAHRRTGLLVPPRDAAAISRAVAELAARPDVRLRYGRAGRAEVAARTWESVGDLLVEHYRAVLHERAGGARPDLKAAA